MSLRDEWERREGIGPREGYDVAQICLNGHVANDHCQAAPHSSKPSCEKCPEKTITACPKCNAPIRGGMFGVWGDYKAPARCLHCSAAFPWTEKRIQEVVGFFVEVAQADGETKRAFEVSVNEVAGDAPGAPLAARRISRLLDKLGKEDGDALRTVLAQIASDEVKPQFLPR